MSFAARFFNRLNFLPSPFIAPRAVSKLCSIYRATTTATKTPASSGLCLRRAKSSTPKMSVSTESEKLIQRNPHPDFKKVEASRPDWDTTSTFNYKKTPQPDWKLGSGANSLPASSSAKKHISIDPYEPGRPAPFNYKLLISSIVPRPIGFVSSQSTDADGSGKTTTNLAPFSYFNMINHDPPLFVLGLASSLERPKDTLKNLVESKECVVNIISEHFIEAANSTSIDAPYGVSEWVISGLTPVYDCKDVKAARVGEAVFSAECKVESIREFESRATPGKKTGCMVVLEATRFWVREDAINEDKNLIDPAVLAPVSRLGGITYCRTTDGFELPRPVFEKDVGGTEGYEKFKKEKEAQQQK